MAIFSALTGRTSNLDKPEEWLVDSFGGNRPTLSGERVTADSALKVSTVLACVKVVSEDLAKLPLNLYKTDGKGSREKQREHPVFKLLRRKPNRFQTAYNFKNFMEAEKMLEGNAYAVILRDGRGNPVELIPQQSRNVAVLESTDGELFYDLGGNKGIAPAEDIIHLRNSLSRNGKTGISSIKLMAETIGLAAAAEKHGAAVFGNGASPGGYLKFPGKLDKPVKDKIKAEWEEMHRGVENSNRVAVLTEGMGFEASAISHENLQYLETRTFQAHQICGFFRVAPHLVGIMDSATFSNIEHQGQQHASNALLPNAVNWEEELFDKLLFEDEQDGGYYFEYLMDSVMRADFKTRLEGYQIAINTSMMTPDEARQKENWNSRPEAGFLMRPMNMEVIGKEQEQGE